MASSKFKSVPRVSLVAILRSVETQGNASDLVRFFVFLGQFGKLLISAFKNANDTEQVKRWRSLIFQMAFCSGALGRCCNHRTIERAGRSEACQCPQHNPHTPGQVNFCPFFPPRSGKHFFFFSQPDQIFSSFFPAKLFFFFFFSRPSKFFSSFFPAR